MVLFSGDFDKVMAAFIIANGALAMGKEVTMFVTFWGLDAIKKPTMGTAGKNILEKMVTLMRPKGPAKLPTSKMNFGGIGPKLFHYMMGKKNVEPLSSLIDMSREFGSEDRGLSDVDGRNGDKAGRPDRRCGIRGCCGFPR